MRSVEAVSRFIAGTVGSFFYVQLFNVFLFVFSPACVSYNPVFSVDLYLGSA